MVVLIDCVAVRVGSCDTSTQTQTGSTSFSVGERETGGFVFVSHLEDFEVVLRFFYQVSDGKVHSLPVPEQHERKQNISYRTAKQLYYQHLSLLCGEDVL